VSRFRDLEVLLNHAVLSCIQVVWTCLLSDITVQLPSAVGLQLQISFGPTEILSKLNEGDQKKFLSALHLPLSRPV
jgi:hypothetical protein